MTAPICLLWLDNPCGFVCLPFDVGKKYHAILLGVGAKMQAGENQVCFSPKHSDTEAILISSGTPV